MLPPTEHIVFHADYTKALANLPATGTEGQTAESVPLMTREKTDQTINAGKWMMWRVAPCTIPFIWENDTWQPPGTLVIRNN